VRARVRARVRAERVHGREVSGRAAEMARASGRARGARWMTAWLVAACAGALAAGRAEALDATSASVAECQRQLGAMRRDVGAANSEAAKWRSEFTRERARADFEAAEKKKALAEVAKLEEALDEARRGVGATEVVRMAKDAANEGVKRAKTLVRDAKPLIEDGMRKAAPALKNAGERAKRGYARQIRNVQSNLAPVRRKMKAKMKQIDLLKPYATDRHINNLFQATYTLILALCVHRALGVLYRFAFGRRSRSVPRHVRSKSVELRPLSPDR